MEVIYRVWDVESGERFLTVTKYILPRDQRDTSHYYVGDEPPPHRLYQYVIILNLHRRVLFSLENKCGGENYKNNDIAYIEN